MDTAPEVDSYLAALPEDARAALEALRRLIHDAVPDAEESISYDMPTFTYRGKRLIYFAAWAKHLAIYGTPAGTVQFRAANPPSDTFVREQLALRVAAIDAELDRKGRKGRR